MNQEQIFSSGSVDELQSNQHELILFNDDVNSFDFIISSLVEVCGHQIEQAEQCAIIAHFNGKCSIKSGSFSDLEPMNNELNHRGISTLLN
jgi:ATP-dependent Clp protease adaptor protein ClpS